MITKLNQFSKPFQTIDTTFASLYIIVLTEEELSFTNDSTDILQETWMKINFNLSPKVHILFEHTCKQQQRLGGITDKTIDFV